MTYDFLLNQIFTKKTYLCVGLDTDQDKLPEHLTAAPDGMFEFNKQIIDATLDTCVAYKINTAFYEALGSRGWDIMERTVKYIPSTHFKIADAKRGDIGNTSAQYAKAFFDTLDFDAITIAPYMGADSVKPFLNYNGKWGIVLGLTSNTGSEDFQQQKTGKEFLYEKVIRTVSTWGTELNLMFVVGATKATDISSIRRIIPKNFLLVPGVGFQGGSLQEVSKIGLTGDCGLLVNVSRAIIYASAGEDFASEARLIAQQYQHEMAGLLKM